MDPIIYQKMAKIEDNHWWFVSRKTILNTLLKNLSLPSEAKILDAGCGTGGNLEMLSQHGQVYAMELDTVARDIAAARQLGQIKAGRLPDEIPFSGQKFDLIVLLDVLEHLEDDVNSLRALREHLQEGGYLLVTVPAFPWLWSHHDESHHHKRRYIRRGLRRVAISAGLMVNYVSYFNFFLFPLIAIIRLAQNVLKTNNNDDLSLPSKAVNKALTRLFSSERYILERSSFPFGVSLLLLARSS